MSIQRMVHRLIHKYKTRDPFVIAEYQNIHVQYKDLPASIRGMAVKALKQRYIILNPDMTYSEQRGICGHELGHHHLHPGSSYQFIEEHSLFLPGRYEREANEFAAALLIDGNEIENGDSIIDIASKNDIPVELVGYYKPLFDGITRNNKGNFGMFKWIE